MSSPRSASVSATTALTIWRRPDERVSACDRCLVRGWLLSRLAANLEVERGRISGVLELSDEELIDALAGAQASAVIEERSRFDADSARSRAADAGLESICRCDPAYPVRLRALASPPAVLHVAGGVERFLTLVAADPVAIVGARRASSYGIDVAGALGRGLGAAGVPVISGMALGIDSAAHSGALAVEAATVAVLPGGADRPYPASKRTLHRRIRLAGAVASELPPGSPVWRWMFPARNRVIAALAALTIVVEAGERSGALLTAAAARELGRPVGAVPGKVTSPLSVGTHGLLLDGAVLVRGAQDVLDALYGAGARVVPDRSRQELPADLQALLAAIAAGNDTARALALAGFGIEQTLAGVGALELAGYLRREAGGRFAVVS
jgi:DNA processing protein